MENFKRRFIVSLIITIPILLLSPMIQEVLGLREALRFRGDVLVLWVLSSFIFFYRGWPFLKGLVSELSDRQPGMMTLIGLAISVAYIYSSAVVFGVEGELLFWELATLIDVMLLGHWIEMKTIAGASQAVESLVRLVVFPRLRESCGDRVTIEEPENRKETCHDTQEYAPREEKHIRTRLEIRLPLAVL